MRTTSTPGSVLILIVKWLIGRMRPVETRPCLRSAAIVCLPDTKLSSRALPRTARFGALGAWRQICPECCSRCPTSCVITYFHATLFVVLLSFVPAMPQVVSVLFFLAGLLVIVPIYYHQVFKERKVAQRVQRCSQAVTVLAAGAAATGPN